jgi:hypothetical protein
VNRILDKVVWLQLNLYRYTLTDSFEAWEKFIPDHHRRSGGEKKRSSPKDQSAEEPTVFR